MLFQVGEYATRPTSARRKRTGRTNPHEKFRAIPYPIYIQRGETIAVSPLFPSPNNRYMSLSPIPRSVEDEEESVMGGLGLIFLLEAAEGGEVDGFVIVDEAFVVVV